MRGRARLDADWPGGSRSWRRHRSATDRAATARLRCRNTVGSTGHPDHRPHPSGWQNPVTRRGCVREAARRNQPGAPAAAASLKARSQPRDARGAAISTRYHLSRVASLTAAVLFAGCATTAWCQSAKPEDPALGTPDVTGVGKIGRLHDNIRRAQRRKSLYQEIGDTYTDYTNWKTQAENETNVQFSMDVSLLDQWGFSDGGSPALQVYAAPSVDWTVFKSKEWGTGSVQLAYNAVTRYPTTQNAADVQSNLGLITPINDYPTRTLSFAQLTYTQATPDNTWLLTAGQYPLFNFDGNAYLGNQQQNFNNYLFAQNATQTYLQTGLGAYIQFNATHRIQLAAGFQGANNVLGQTISGKNFNRDCCAWFAYAQWTPSFHGPWFCPVFILLLRHTERAIAGCQPRVVPQCSTEPDRHLGAVCSGEWRERVCHSDQERIRAGYRDEQSAAASLNRPDRVSCRTKRRREPANQSAERAQRKGNRGLLDVDVLRWPAAHAIGAGRLRSRAESREEPRFRVVAAHNIHVLTCDQGLAECRPFPFAPAAVPISAATSHSAEA